jgi:hypothetical protein
MKPIRVRDPEHRQAVIKGRFKQYVASLPQEKRIELLRGLIAEAERRDMKNAERDLVTLLTGYTEAR